MLTQELLRLARCPRCLAQYPGDKERGSLEAVDGGVVCHTCGLAYGAVKDSGTDDIAVSSGVSLPRRGYLDLMPRDELGQQTKYLEEEFEHELDHQHLSIPLLGAGVRHSLLRKMLKPARHEIALEVGCGDGRFSYWNRKLFKTVVSLDAAPLFSEEVLNDVPLVRGDCRQLPFADASFDKVFTLDLMEHLPADGIAPFFAELNRVLKPGGAILVFSNTRELGKLWFIIKQEKRLANFLAKKGIFDFKRDIMRKSDHIKAVETWEQLENYVAQAGLKIVEKRFWNGVFQNLVDNLIIKTGEYGVRKLVRFQVNNARQAQKKDEKEALRDVKSRLASGRLGLTNDWADGGGFDRMVAEVESNKVTSQAEKVAAEAETELEEDAAIDLQVRKYLKRNLSRTRSKPMLISLQVLTALMKLDILLFGRLRTGPFFIVLHKK